MNNNNPFDDLSERLLELGSSTIKKAGKTAASAVKTVASEVGTQLTGHTKHESENKQTQNFSPLDLESISKQQDEAQIAQIRAKLNQFTPANNQSPEDQNNNPLQSSPDQKQQEYYFRKYKDEELEYQARKKASEREKKQQEEYEKMKKEKQEEEQKRLLYQQEEPTGKIRRSIFSRVKRQSKPELKLGQGKQ